MTLPEFGLFLISIVASVVGQFFLKAGAKALGQVEVSNAIGLILNILRTRELLAGLACYGIGAIAYILVLTRVNLSVAGPAISLSYVFAVLVGYFYFKESIPLSRYIGMALIICGVVLVLWKK